VTPPRGPAIDVFFNFSGGCCRRYQQHPLGARPRRLLQLRSWLLSERPAAPPKGGAIDVFFNFGGGCCQRYQQHPQGAWHQCLLQLRWWLLLEIPAATPRRPAIDVFLNFSGGYCRRYQQPGDPPSTSSSTSVVGAARDTDSTL
jgi:hypothetical protein